MPDACALCIAAATTSFEDRRRAAPELVRVCSDCRAALDRGDVSLPPLPESEVPSARCADCPVPPLTPCRRCNPRGLVAVPAPPPMSRAELAELTRAPRPPRATPPAWANTPEPPMNAKPIPQVLPPTPQGTPGLTRSRIEALLREADAPLPVTDIAERLDLHRSSVSYHLDKLGAEKIGTGPNVAYVLPGDAPAPAATMAPAKSGPMKKGTRAARKGPAVSVRSAATPRTPATEPTAEGAPSSAAAPPPSGAAACPPPGEPLGGPSFGDVLRTLTALEAGDVATVRRWLVEQLGRVA